MNTYTHIYICVCTYTQVYTVSSMIRAAQDEFSCGWFWLSPQPEPGFSTTNLERKTGGASSGLSDAAGWPPPPPLPPPPPPPIPAPAGPVLGGWFLLMSRVARFTRDGFFLRGFVPGRGSYTFYWDKVAPPDPTLGPFTEPLS